MGNPAGNPGSLRTRARRAAAAAACGALFAATPALAQGEDGSARYDGVTPHIEAVLRDPAVIREIRRWGMSLGDVRHDIDALPLQDRARLAFLLARAWPHNETRGRAAQQAQFLVTMSLLRESTLFASVISRNPSVLQ